MPFPRKGKAFSIKIMKMKFINSLFLTGLAIITLGSPSCTKEATPLYPNRGENGNINYTWAATADSLQQTTYNVFLTSDGTFKQDNAGNNSFNYWWNAHMLDVLVDGFLRTKDDNYKTKMKALVNGIKVKNGGTYRNEFNDDMQWLGMACIRAYNATGDALYKQVAQELWTEIKKSWSDVFGGGITWKINTPNGKNACSNAPAAILAVRLYQIDKNQDDLDWAKRIYAWQKSKLVDPVTGLVWDNISLSNGAETINKSWIFTYNQGTYIGAATELYTATKNSEYLFDAVKTSNSSMTSSNTTSEGILKNENQGDGGLFKGILVRYLAQLIQQPDLAPVERDKFVKFLKFNAETLFKSGLARPAMMISPDWKRKPEGNTDLSTQLSGIMLLEAAAALKADNKF